MINDETIARLLKDLVKDLVQEKYKKIIDTDRGGRLSLEEVKYAIESYPGHLTMPPDESFSKIHKYEYNEEVRTQGCLVEYELWYDHQESDLTLSVEILNDKKEPQITIRDIHVL